VVGYLRHATGWTKHVIDDTPRHIEAGTEAFDGDGDLDVLGKPYNWDAPRLNIWLAHRGALTGAPGGLIAARRERTSRSRRTVQISSPNEAPQTFR
jgi:hypothetical protein